MTTTELTGVEPVGRRTIRPRRRGVAALVVGALVAIAIAITAVEMRSSGAPARSAPPPVAVSVAPGPTYPAALIHRISARPLGETDRNG
jgi:hypothetical protein